MHGVLLSVLPAFSVACVGASILGGAGRVALIGALGIASLLASRFAAMRLRPTLVVVAGLLGCLHGGSDETLMPRVPDGLVSLSGTVAGIADQIVELPPRVFLTAAIVEGGEVVIPRLTVQWAERSLLPPVGSEVRVNGWIHTDERGVRLDMASEGASSMTVPTVSRVEKLIASCRAVVKHRLRAALDPVAEEVTLALVLGESNRRSALNENLKRCGALHLLAVSGLHLGLLLVILLRVTPIGRLPLAPQVAVILSVLLFYAAMTGTRPPVVRAFISVTLLMVSRVAHRPVDAGWVLCVVSGSVLLLEPQMATNLGFLMSFSALGGIVFLARPVLAVRSAPLDRWLLRKGVGRLRTTLRTGVVTGLAATLATIPIAVSVFHGASIFSPISSIILLPFVMLLMVTAPLVLVDANIAPFTEAPAHAIAQIAEQLARVPFVFHATPQPSYAALLVHVVLLPITGFIMYRVREGCRWRFLMLPVLSAAVLVGTAGRDGEAAVHIVDAGDAKALVCQAGENCVVIAPAGSRRQDGGARAVAEVLDRQERRVVDCALLRDRGYASMRFIAALSQRVHVKSVALPSAWQHDAKVLRRLNIRTILLSEHEVLRQGAIEVQILQTSERRLALVVRVEGQAILGLPIQSGETLPWPPVRALVLPTIDPSQARSLLVCCAPSQVVFERSRNSVELRQTVLMHVQTIERPRGHETVKVSMAVEW